MKGATCSGVLQTCLEWQRRLSNVSAMGGRFSHNGLAAAPKACMPLHSGFHSGEPSLHNERTLPRQRNMVACCQYRKLLALMVSEDCHAPLAAPEPPWPPRFLFSSSNKNGAVWCTAVHDMRCQIACTQPTSCGLISSSANKPRPRPAAAAWIARGCRRCRWFWARRRNFSSSAVVFAAEVAKGAKGVAAMDRAVHTGEHPGYAAQHNALTDAFIGLVCS